MGTALTTTAPDALALAAYRPEWSLATIAETATIEQVDDALAQVDRWLVPIKDRDRRFDMIDPDQIVKAIHENADTKQMVEAVKMIGRKVRPDFSASQASHWVAAVVASLTDLPPHVAVQACKAALHIPFEFPGSVEKGIREEAVKVAERYRLARLRLENLRREIARAAQPKLPPPPPSPPMTQEQLDRMAGAPAESMQAMLLNLAVGCGIVIRHEDGSVTLNPDHQEEPADE